jgi:AcrR family transcriptional regulator
MSSGVDNPSKPVRRRHDARASRQALLHAAGVLFDERGYDAATLRDIGERAGIDPALIARYFGSKEGLYLAAMAQDDRPPLPTDPHAALQTMLARSAEQGIGPVPRAMADPTLTDDMREQVRTVVGRRVVEPLTAALQAGGAADARLRAELLVALAIGVSLTRASGTLPELAGSSLTQVLDVLGPLAEALSGGD